jgi:hypothetical protein
MMAEAATVQRLMDGSGLRYRTHEQESVPEPAETAVTPVSNVMDAEASKAWNEWIDGRLSTERESERRLTMYAMGELVSEMRQERKEAIEKAVCAIANQLREVKGLLGTTLAALDDARKGLQQQHEVIEGLRRQEFERTVRDRTIIERSARVAELQRENAESRVALASQHLEQAFDQRDARLNLIETRLEMLCRFLSVGGLDLPKGL